MKIEPLPKIPDVLLLTPKVYADNRGYFLESYRSNDLYAQLGGRGFVQGNVSVSVPWTLRGIHYQVKNPQGKLVSCLAGEIYDVAVDLRPDSRTFLQWVGARLSGANHQALWIPPGFGHAFLALGQGATVQYECSTEYDETQSRSIVWNDSRLGIKWPLSPTPLDSANSPILSLKDLHAPTFDETTELPRVGEATHIDLRRFEVGDGNGIAALMKSSRGVTLREIPTEEQP